MDLCRRLATVLAAALAAVAALAAPAGAHDLAGAEATHVDTPAQLSEVDIAGTLRAHIAAADGLPDTWCGAETRTDLGAPVPAAHIKVVYAYASDQPDRFATWKDDVQRSVEEVERFVGAQSGGTKAIRFDMGTGCGAGYVDVQTVALPGPRASYLDDLPALEAAVAPALGPAIAPRNVLVLADGLTSSANLHGVGEAFLSHDEKSASNPANRGGAWAALWLPRQSTPPAGRALWPEGYLHEISHTLGAVQWSAPHSTMPAGQVTGPYGHCWDGYDVMCYVEAPGASHAMTYPCAPLPGVMSQTYDCGGDDYFNPAPPPGSYLATHWNVYDSAFLAGCAELAPACGGGRTTRTPTPPVSTAPPAISGQAMRGQTLTASTGTWLNSPTRYAYRWQRDAGSEWIDLAPTGASHTIGARDVGHRLRVRVVATNADGATVADAAPVGPATLRPVTLRRALRVTAGRGRGRTVGSVRLALSLEAWVPALRAMPGRMRLAAGRYELLACVRAAGAAAPGRCARRRLVVRRAGMVALPPVSLRPIPLGRGELSFRVTAVGRRFTAGPARVRV
jgi:hypothetical protein